MAARATLATGPPSDHSTVSSGEEARLLMLMFMFPVLISSFGSRGARRGAADAERMPPRVRCNILDPRMRYLSG